MTYDWSEVQAEACRLSCQGKTLDQVRRVFEGREIAQASTRAWRNKWREWGLTHANRSRVHKPTSSAHGRRTHHTSCGTASPRRAVRHSGFVTPSTSGGNTQRSGTPFVSQIIDLTNEVTDDESVGDEGSEDGSHQPIADSASPTPQADRTWPPRQDNHGMHQDLSTVALDVTMSGKDEDSMLHRAAIRQNGAAALKHIIQLLRSHELSLDCYDSGGQTALGLAIKANNSANVDILLDAHASVDIYDGDGRQPLHTALVSRAGLRICTALLKNGALVDTQLKSSRQSSSNSTTVLGLIFDSLKEATNDRSRHDLYAVLEYILRDTRHDHVLRPERDEDVAQFRAFLDTWVGFCVAESPTTKFAERCLRMLLRRGFSPFEQFDHTGPCYSPTGCNTLVAYALFHATKYQVLNHILECCDVALFGQDLLEYLISACKDHWPSRAPPVTRYLHALLNRGIHFDKGRNPISKVLQDFPNENPITKTQIIRLFVRFGGFNLTELSSAYGHPLDQLVHVPKPLRWQLAEEILVHDEGLSATRPASPNESPESIFRYHPSVHYRQYASLSFKGSLAKYTSFDHTLQQCIVHVLTKLMIEDSLPAPSLGTPIVRLREALRLRKAMDLPDIAINMKNAYLLDITERWSPDDRSDGQLPDQTLEADGADNPIQQAQHSSDVPTTWDMPEPHDSMQSYNGLGIGEWTWPGVIA